MSAKPRDSIKDRAFMGVVYVCSALAWAPIALLISGEPLPLGKVVSIAFGVLVWWSCVFFFGLIMRDTLRQRGMWAIDLKLPVCTQCGKPLRTMRFTVRLQRTWGCWTCHECGFEMSKWGRTLKEQNNLARWAVLRALGTADKHEQRPRCRDERIQSVKDQIHQGEEGGGSSAGV